MPRFSLSVVLEFVFFHIYSVFLSHLFCRFVSVCSCLASDCNVSLLQCFLLYLLHVFLCLHHLPGYIYSRVACLPLSHCRIRSS